MLWEGGWTFGKFTTGCFLGGDYFNNRLKRYAFKDYNLYCKNLIKCEKKNY